MALNTLRCCTLALGLAAVLLALSLVPAAAQRDLDDPDAILPPDIALPDLQTMPITDLVLQVNSLTGERLLRFGNSVVNTGAGALDLVGRLDPQQGIILVDQHLHGEQEVTVRPLDGVFYYSGEHLHWHWEGFAAYQVWSVRPGGDLDRVLVANDKVGFCLFDTARASRSWVEEHVAGELTAAPRRFTSTCHLGRQGISVGWYDLYRRSLPGQALDVTSLVDGVYALRSTVDPLGALYESNRDNNDTLLYFALHDGGLFIIGQEYSLVDYFAHVLRSSSTGYEEIKVLLGVDGFLD